MRYWSTIFYRYSITILYIYIDIDIDVPLVAQCSWWLPRLHHSRLTEITKGHSGHITFRQFDDGTTPTKIAGGSTAIIICWRRHLILSRGFPTVFCLNKCKIGWKKMKSIKTSSKSRWQTQRNSPKELALASLAWQRCWKTVGTFNENCTMFYMPKNIKAARSIQSQALLVHLNHHIVALQIVVNDVILVEYCHALRKKWLAEGSIRKCLAFRICLKTANNTGKCSVIFLRNQVEQLVPWLN